MRKFITGLMLTTLAAVTAPAIDWVAAERDIVLAIEDVGQAAHDFQTAGLVKTYQQIKTIAADVHDRDVGKLVLALAKLLPDLEQAIRDNHNARLDLAKAWQHARDALTALHPGHPALDSPMTSCATRCSHDCGGGFWGALDVASCVSHCPEGCAPSKCGNCHDTNVATCKEAS